MIFVAILVVAIARVLKPLHLDKFTAATQSLNHSIIQSLTYTFSLARYLDLLTFFQA